VDYSSKHIFVAVLVIQRHCTGKAMFIIVVRMILSLRFNGHFQVNLG